MTTSPSKALSAAAFLVAAVLIEALPLRAQQRETPQEQTVQEGRRVHVVRPGDTLWDLARFYLDDPFLWPEIYRLNTMVVEDPHWIYPDEQLQLPFPGEVAQRPPPDTGPAQPEVKPQQPQVTGEATTIFAGRQYGRKTLVYKPTPPAPSAAVSEGDFRGSGMLVKLDELGPMGRVIDHISPTVVPVQHEPTVPVYGRMYVSHPGGKPPKPGDQLLIFRVDRKVAPYGYIIRPTGEATVAAVYDDVSIAVVTRLYNRVLRGDHVVLSQPFRERPGVHAEPVSSGPEGQLVAFLDIQPVASVDDVAFVDVGRDDGVDVGDEFDIYIGERRSAGGLELPPEHVAVGRVVRVTQATATLRLVTMRHPALRVGLPVRLVRKMPS